MIYYIQISSESKSYFYIDDFTTISCKNGFVNVKMIDYIGGHSVNYNTGIYKDFYFSKEKCLSSLKDIYIILLRLESLKIDKKTTYKICVYDKCIVEN